ncbi:unnamed protein product [Cuscuta epithymum]|uniref:F-box domain-containing protein n=1 Tax=Cuscuta epithymum TaxID=186058 RepID=A0AAV0DHI0_9ASTE|nr:unnamed protein product [Cuscuta epithymum]
MGNIQASLIRQPPPPPSQHPRSSIAANEEEEEALEIAGGNYYLTRYRRRLSKSLMSLHDDMLFEVLTRVPAQDIYDAAMYVCRKWYRIIHTHKFIDSHLRHSPHGLLLRCPHTPAPFMVARQGQLETSYLTKFKHRVSAGCNGLLLEFEYNDTSHIVLWTLYIVNPVTKQVFVLPGIENVNGSKFFGISYAATSMVYKVVAIVLGPQLKILTVGVDDSWRSVCTKHLRPLARSGLAEISPLTTEGFMHWPTSVSTVVTLNVETEMVEESSGPIPQGHGAPGSAWVSTGSKLSYLMKFERFGWHVWEMEPESKEWRKLPDIVISLKDQKRKFQRLGLEKGQQLEPIGWIKYKELLALTVSRVLGTFTVFVYNLVTHEVVKVDLPDWVVRHSVVPHQNSLVWLPGSS